MDDPPLRLGPRWERVVDLVTHSLWKTLTFVAALRTTGLVAPTVVDVLVTGDVFLAYVEQQLVCLLQLGEIVVFDNLQPHKQAGVRTTLEAFGAELRLLPQ